MDAMNTRRILFFLLAFSFGMLPGVSLAGDIVFLSHKRLPVVMELARQVGGLLQRKTSVEVITDSGYSVAEAANAVVVVGPQALALWKPGKTPAVAVFVSRAQVTDSLESLHTALYLEPPVVRQVALARSLIGDELPVGVLAQSRSRLAVSGLDAEMIRKYAVKPYFLDDYGNINRALVDLLDECYVLVGQYDTELYSAKNIKNILITAYRQNRPLIGPSSAYIRAGSLATTYSDLDDVALRLSEILTAGLTRGQWLSPGYNPHFKVRFNEQVARSLNLTLPDAEQLVEALKRREVQ